MARGRKRGFQGRDANVITSLFSPTWLPLNSTFLREVEDLREFNPSRDVLLPRSFSYDTSLRPAPQRRDSFFPSSQLDFDDPYRVLVCVRRKRRREVIFASGNGGRRGRQRRHRRNRFSDYHC